MKEILAIDAKKFTGYSIPIGMFEKVVRVAKKQPSKAKNRAFSTWE
jgi:hypothetical protein